MSSQRYQSWGRVEPPTQAARALYWRDEPLPIDAADGASYLPFGNGRSYGDVCLNDGGTLLDCRHLNRLIHFDAEQGTLRCEAGVLLADILRFVTERGWFVPVSPGTQYVTVGGAIANDVHGKNHHRAGTFGQHLRCFELLRSDGQRLLCSATDNSDFFRATIGGLGLTGVITWAEFSLRAIDNVFIDQESIRYSDLNEFFALARESDQHFEHTVAWIDCLATGAQLGRGLFMRGNHSSGENPPHQSPQKSPRQLPPRRRLALPFTPPFALVNGPGLKLFNALYYRRQRSAQVHSRVHYQRFFYPLDAIAHWNRMYGPRGFYQYQCVLPEATMEGATRQMLERIASAGAGSFLATLKLFGNRPSPGLLSFPMPGATLALDFPNQGDKTLRLLDALDRVTLDAGGRVNPSKDGRMSAAAFQQSYPNWDEMNAYKDSRLSSSFWRRVSGEAA
ncbi:MAG: FAD-binding oxidoreductase [Pseudomonadota bacterium]